MMRWPWVRRSKLEHVTGLNAHLGSQLEKEHRENDRLRLALESCRARSARLEAELQDSRSTNQSLRTQIAVDKQMDQLYLSGIVSITEGRAS